MSAGNDFWGGWSPFRMTSLVWSGGDAEGRQDTRPELTLDKIMAAKRLMDDLGAASEASVSALRIIENELLADRVQVRFPRSKKRRIQKKWRNREANYRMIPKRDVYRFGDALICHPDIAREIRKGLTTDGLRK